MLAAILVAGQAEDVGTAHVTWTFLPDPPLPPPNAPADDPK
jgi:hypothetical protein